MFFSPKDLAIAGISLGIGTSGGVFIDIGRTKVIEFNQTIGETSAKYTTKNQWRFLYLLGTKIFNYLSKDKGLKDKKSKLGIDSESNVVEWLKTSFNVDNFETQDNWESFRDICISQLKREDKTFMFKVNSRESRLCFMGITSDVENPNNHLSHVLLQLREAGNIGFLGKWKFDKKGSENEDSVYKDIHPFQNNNWTKYNYQLWESFRDSEHGNSVADNNEIEDTEFKEAWEEWYQSEAYSYGSALIKGEGEDEDSERDNTEEGIENSSKKTNIDPRTKLSVMLKPTEDKVKPESGN